MLQGKMVMEREKQLMMKNMQENSKKGKFKKLSVIQDRNKEEAINNNNHNKEAITIIFMKYQTIMMNICLILAM